MATPTQTGAGGQGGGGAGGPVVREQRAIEAAASGPVFRTPMQARVEQQSQKVADRWAPDGADAEKQQPSLRSLGFADRMIVGYLGGGSREPARDDRERDREREREQQKKQQTQAQGAPGQTAATQAAAQATQTQTPAPQTPAPQTPAQAAKPATQAAPAQAARPAERTEPRPRQPLAASRSMGGAMDRAVPSVSWLFPTPWFEDELKWAAAAKAATRETERAAARERDPMSAQTSRAVGVGVPLDLVAPSMAPQRQTERVPARETEQARPQQAQQPANMAALRAYSPIIDPAAARAAEMLAGMARREAAQARRQAQGDDVQPRPAPILEFVAPADLTAQRQASAQTAAAAQRTLDAQAADKAAAEKKAAAAKAAADKKPEPRQEPKAATAPQLLAQSALSREADRVAPSAGPRVMLPAGLGGLTAATQAARTIEQPAAKTEARAAAPTPAAPMVGRDRPAALDHMVWSDRWLARFAGASAGALKTFDRERAPATGTSAQSVMSGWDPAWVKPPPVTTSRDHGEARPRPAPEMVVPSRSATRVVDEAEPVSDAEFGAIAAAASADRARQSARSAAAAATAKAQAAQKAAQAKGPVAKVEPPRAPAADRALDQVKPSRNAGLGAGLGASPVAPLLANLVEVPTQPAFDARQLSAASLASLPPVTAGRGARGLRELAGRAPDEVFVAQAEERRAAEAAKAKAAAAEKSRERDVAKAQPVVAPKPVVAEQPKPVVAEQPKPVAAQPPKPRALEPDAARPGNIGSSAESFAQRRAMAASDLSLDFLSPEVLQAARAYGFGPIDAARAQRLAASGRPQLADLASQVDRVFVSALSTPKGQADDLAKAQQAQADARAKAEAASKAEAAGKLDAASKADAAKKSEAAKKAADAAALQPPPPPAQVQPLRDAAPARTPRGAFLLPDASARAMGVQAKNAEEARPDIRFALDLVAAGHVADAATARGATPDKDRASAAGPERPPAPRTEDDRRDPSEARALLPRELWSVFDIVYVSLGESSSAGADGRPLAPAARAAKALALTSKSRDGGDLPLSARARAAAAWAVLPTVIAGGPARNTGPQRDRDRARPVVAGEPARFEAPRMDGLVASSSRAGESLNSLVAPSFVSGDQDRNSADERTRAQAQARAQHQQQLARESVRNDMAVVQTGTPPQQQRQAEPPPQPRQEQAPQQRSTQPRQYSSQPAPPGAGDVPAWFQDAAKKYFGEAGGATGGMSLAELTLVTAAPQAQVAASATSAARPVTQAQSTSASGAAGGDSPAAQQAETKADIDKIAQEVFEQICRMLEVARERSGDPWQR